MSLLNPSQWKQWAQEWSFVHSPQHVLAYPNEWMAGMRDRRLVKVAWVGTKGRCLSVTVRFPATSSSASLRETLRQDETLAKLPGWKRLKPIAAPEPHAAGAARPGTVGSDLERPAFKLNALSPPGLVVDDRSVVWSHVFSWRRPKPAQLRQWLEALLQAIARATQAFEDRCELCGTTHVNGFVLFEGVPMLVCPGCRERTALEGQMAEQRYAQEEANVPLGLAYGTIGAIVGAAAWAAFTIFTNRIYVAIALGIGMLVAWSYKLGARKVDRVGQVAGALLTVAAVLLGDVLIYAWQLKESRPDIGFRLDAGWWAFLQMWKERPGDIILSVCFGAAGAMVAVSALRKPRFTPRIASPEEAVAKKKAA